MSQKSSFSCYNIDHTVLVYAKTTNHLSVGGQSRLSKYPPQATSTSVTGCYLSINRYWVSVEKLVSITHFPQSLLLQFLPEVFTTIEATDVQCTLPWEICCYKLCSNSMQDNLHCRVSIKSTVPAIWWPILMIIIHTTSMLKVQCKLHVHTWLTCIKPLKNPMCNPMCMTTGKGWWPPLAWD